MAGPPVSEIAKLGIGTRHMIAAAQSDVLKLIIGVPPYGLQQPEFGEVPTATGTLCRNARANRPPPLPKLP